MEYVFERWVAGRFEVTDLDTPTQTAKEYLP
jgi:hypothetical protein